MLHVWARISILAFAILSVPAWALDFAFLPKSKPAEKEFHTLVSAGNYRKALSLWPSVHQTSNFGRTHNGKATFAYLLYQNGMRFMALEFLINNTQPQSLNSQLKKYWRTELRNSLFVQKGWIPTKGGWRSIVDNQKVVLNLRNKKDIDAAFARAARLDRSQINQKARIWWQIATKAPQTNHTESSIRALKLLLESGQMVVGQDLVYAALGRVLFQNGDFDSALNAYSKIPKSSTLWLDALEERAWVHLRKNDFDKALGDSITLLSSALAPLVGPESFYLNHWLSLKVCDYPRIFANSEKFKKIHKQRLIELDTLARTGTNKYIKSVLDQFEKKGVSIEAAGPQFVSVPRGVLRDYEFLTSMNTNRQLTSELATSSALGKDLLSNGYLSMLRESAKSQIEKNRRTAQSRVQYLAKDEVNEYRQILNKMHVVEAEVIQRLAVDESLTKGKRKELSEVKHDGKDVLVFPYDGNEVWFDELDNYKARVKDCPKLEGESV